MTKVPFISNREEANRILDECSVLEYAWAWEVIQRIVAHLPVPGFGSELSQSFTLQLNETTLFRCLLERADAGDFGWRLIAAQVDRLEDIEFVRIVDL